MTWKVGRFVCGMSELFYEQLGGEVRRRREAIGMTQATLASRTGMLRTTITNIERGRQGVMAHQVVRLATALGVEAAGLLPRSVESEQANEGAVPDRIQELVDRLDSPAPRKRLP